jgi:hypothetical protein
LGNGEGSEKWDVFEETARFSDGQDDFHSKVAMQPGLPSLNANDAEPKGHPMGIYMQLEDEPAFDARK